MRITVLGDALVVTSSLTVEEIEMLKKYDPDALKLFDADGNQTFGVGYSSGNGNLTKKGVTFGATSNGGFATLSVTLEGTEGMTADALKETVADILGEIPVKLAAVEQAAPAKLAEVREARTTLINSINIL